MTSTISTDANTAAQPARAPFWFWAGLAFVAAAIVLLEMLYPYFFCQDDALSLELPTSLTACRGIWQGIAPRYNPYIFLGSPTPIMGGVYPPMYLAYGIARHLLSDEYATFDVFAAIHLLAGYCLTFAVARRLGIQPALAALCGLTFVLSGPVLVMARCWHSFSVLAVFIPLFALLVDRLRSDAVTWRWPVATGAMLGLYYHSGFPQLFVLGCGLMLVHAVALSALGLVPPWRLRWLVPALALGAAISIPVFFQQWLLSQEITQTDAGGGDGVGGNLLAMLLPFPLVQGTLPNLWGSLNLQWNGHFYYFGTVLLVAFLASVVTNGWWLLRDRSRMFNDATSARLQLALAITAIVAFLLALGQSGGLWWLMGLLPVGLRNNPFRAMPWFVFFACVTGSLSLQDLLENPRVYGGHPTSEKQRRLLAGIVGIGVALVALHLTRIGIAFYTYGFRPYPQLPAEIAELIGPDGNGRQQRIMSFGAMRSTDPSYPVSLPHNLPCTYEVPALLGYDPLVQRFGRYNACLERLGPEPHVALAAYGVRWLLLHRTAWGGWQPETPNRFERVFPFLSLLRSLGSAKDVSLPDLDDVLTILEIPDAAPLAFDTANPTKAIPLHMSAAGLDITLDPKGEPCDIVANFLWYPHMAATADGQPTMVSEDEWHRIVVAAPAGTKKVCIRYVPPRAVGSVLALLAALFAAGTTLACQRKSA